MKELINFLKNYNVKFTVEGDLIIADVINLRYKNITKLPESFGKIKCNEISLDNNQLTSLPESFGNIKCNYISLSYNNLTSLPESFGKIKCNVIYLYNNKLTSLPEAFGKIKCNVIYLYNNKLTSLPEVNKFDGYELTGEYIYCDGILTWYEKVKKIDNYTVYVGYYGNYVATEDNVTFAHGDNIRECIEDIIFKKAKKNVGEYKDIDKEKQLTQGELIIIYRIITGACRGGIKNWMSGKKLKKSYSIKELGELLRENDYGYDKFKDFFNL